MFLGFNNFNEIATYLTKYIGSNATIFIGIVTFLSTFIEQYVYVSSGAIFFLWGLYLIDFSSGVLVSLFITKDFKSKLLPRFLVGLVFGSILIFVCYQAGIHSPIYNYLASIVYAILVGQNLISIFENAGKFGIGSKEFIYFLKDKFSVEALVGKYSKLKTLRKVKSKNE